MAPGTLGDKHVTKPGERGTIRHHPGKTDQLVGIQRGEDEAIRACALESIVGDVGGPIGRRDPTVRQPKVDRRQVGGDPDHRLPLWFRFNAGFV